jgi:hypothetical protein
MARIVRASRKNNYIKGGVDLPTDVIGTVFAQYGNSHDQRKIDLEYFNNAQLVGRTWKNAGNISRRTVKIEYVLKILSRDNIRGLVERFPNIHLIITRNTVGEFTGGMFNGIPLKYLTIEEWDGLHDSISELTSLIELNLINVDIPSEIPVSFVNLTNLRKLTIHQSETLEDISLLSFLTNLVRLDVSYCNDVRDITPLNTLINLEYLYLKFNDITDIRSLTNLNKLKKVKLEGNDGLYDLTPLARDGLKLYIGKDE